MILNKKEIIQLVKREKLLITVLFIIATIFGSVLIFSIVRKMYMGVGFFCYFLAILCLPKINRTKQDIKDVESDLFVEVIGKIEGYFPEKENKENGRWIILIDEQKHNKSFEYILDQKADLTQGSQVKIHMTKYTKIPVRIEVIKNEQTNALA